MKGALELHVHSALMIKLNLEPEQCVQYMSKLVLGCLLICISADLWVEPGIDGGAIRTDMKISPSKNRSILRCKEN